MHPSRHARFALAAFSVVVVGVACASEQSSEADPGSTPPVPRETEPASTPPDTAHPNTTEPLTVPTTSATEVAPTNSQPTTESPTTDTATTTGSRPTVPGPPIHEPLGALVPTLDGYETTPANEVYWPAYDLPGGARAYAADVAVGEDRIGQLVIAEGSGANQLTATYIANLFRNGAQMVGGMTEVDDGMFVVTNVAPVAWQAVNDAAVIVGTIEQDDVGAWTWDHDGRIWAVRGRIDAAGEYARSLIESTGAGSDPFNFQGLTGRLLDRFPDVPGYLYVDLPRPTVLAEMANMLAGDCAESTYLGYVVTDDDPDWKVMAPEDLRLNIASVAPGCVEGGFMEDLTAYLDAQSDLRRESLGDRDVYRDDTDVLHIDGQVIINFFSPDPATVVAMESFMTTFLSEQ